MRWLLLLWLVLVLPGLAQELEIKVDGAPLSTFTLDQLKAKVPEQVLEVPDQHGTVRQYRALPLPELLQALYGDKLRGTQDLAFVCEDGYVASVNARDVTRFRGWLAFGFADGKPFRTDQELGPYQLVWDTRRFPRQRQLGSWPFQVVALDLVDFGKRYGRVIPPAGSRPEVLRGFDHFRHTCLSCHKVNGQGGDRGVDLNWPVSVTTYIKEPYLTRIIDKPTQVRANAIMPGLLPDYPDRKQAIADIVAYLKAMAASRRNK